MITFQLIYKGSKHWQKKANSKPFLILQEV
jgi:hypothetical protein